MSQKRLIQILKRFCRFQSRVGEKTGPISKVLQNITDQNCSEKVFIQWKYLSNAGTKLDHHDHH